jgi:hypothetical protein
MARQPGSAQGMIRTGMQETGGQWCTSAALLTAWIPLPTAASQRANVMTVDAITEGEGIHAIDRAEGSHASWPCTWPD